MLFYSLLPSLFYSVTVTITRCDMCSNTGGGRGQRFSCHQRTSVLRASLGEKKKLSKLPRSMGRIKQILNILLTFTTWSSMMMGPTKVKTIPPITARTPATINPMATLAWLIAMSVNFTDSWRRRPALRGSWCKNTRRWLGVTRITTDVLPHRPDRI